MIHCWGVRRGWTEAHSEFLPPPVSTRCFPVNSGKGSYLRRGWLARPLRPPAVLFQFTLSCDTSSNISIIVELYSVMDFTSRQFRAFLLVAQHRSFSRAAEALYITPSGLSVLIRELEIQLGFRLFNRTTRHVGLTSYGNELLAVARQCLERVDAAVSRIGRSAAGASLSLSVGAPPLV